MKIRIRGNSIRYRLTMSEVAAFSRTGYYEETTNFGTGMFRYALRAASDATHLGASFEGNMITLTMPVSDARTWAENTRIGFDHELSLPGGESLILLVEKDFACLDETGEDQSDNYPNPRAQD